MCYHTCKCKKNILVVSFNTHYHIQLWNSRVRTLYKTWSGYYEKSNKIQIHRQQLKNGSELAHILVKGRRLRSTHIEKFIFYVKSNETFWKSLIKNLEHSLNVFCIRLFVKSFPMSNKTSNHGLIFDLATIRRDIKYIFPIFPKYKIIFHQTNYVLICFYLGPIRFFNCCQCMFYFSWHSLLNLNNVIYTFKWAGIVTVL